MKVLVTGARGMLGADVVETLSDEHRVTAVDVDEMDITDAGSTEATILAREPEVVVHAAAFTDVDGCETNPGKAYRVNAIGTRNIALACRRVGAAMLYISTDFVFDGRKSQPYLERDYPQPLNIYGFSKYAGEYFVSSLLAEYYSVRTAWLYGENGKNFVTTMLKLAEEKESLEVVDDQVGSPTYTVDAARAIAGLIKTRSDDTKHDANYGIYHMVNSGQVSWCGFARKVLELGGRQQVPVKPISSGQLSRPAKRPAYSVLQNSALQLATGDSIRTWETALEDFIGNRMFKRRKKSA